MKYKWEVWMNQNGDLFLVHHGQKGFWSWFEFPGFTAMPADPDRHVIILMALGCEKLGLL